MKNKIVFLLIPSILFLLISSAGASIWGESVTLDDLSDQRTFSSVNYNPPSSEGGLDGYWPYSFTIAWDVTYDVNSMLWTYEYTLSAETEIYGIKFDTGGNPATYSLTTAGDPVWGNFYAKGGKYKRKKIYAYNNALAIDGFDSNNPIDFIVRPDGGDNPPLVPEPLSSILFAAGGVVIICRRYQKLRIGNDKQFT